MLLFPEVLEWLVSETESKRRELDEVVTRIMRDDELSWSEVMDIERERRRDNELRLREILGAVER